MEITPNNNASCTSLGTRRRFMNGFDCRYIITLRVLVPLRTPPPVYEDRDRRGYTKSAERDEFVSCRGRRLSGGPSDA